jgi:putative endonuclease
MHYVYVLQNKNNEHYIGYTKDLKRRVDEHRKSRGDFSLFYYEAYTHASSARNREQKLKQYGSAWRGLKSRF